MYGTGVMRVHLRLLSACLLSFASLPALSQLPLNIENRLIQPSTMKMEAGSAYRHAERFEPMAVSVDGRTLVSGHTHYAEMFDVSARLRYGLSSSMEFHTGLRAARFANRGRAFPDSGFESQVLEAGLNFLAVGDGAMPALLVQLGTDLFTNQRLPRSGLVLAGSARASATAYRSIDPVVLSVAAGYEYRREIEVANMRVDPGDLAWLAPQVNFAVNERVTLVGGFGVYFQSAERLEGRKVGDRLTMTSLRMGSGVEMSPRSTVFLMADFAAVGQRSARVAVDWVYEF